MLSPEATRHLTVLDDFLVDCFSSTELVRLVEQSFGTGATADLPVNAESSRLFMFHTVRVLLRRGLLSDTFFAALSKERPQRQAEIRRLAAAFSCRIDTDPSESQTVVWRGEAKDGSRPIWVSQLEQNLLARDGLGPDDASAPELEQKIDSLARRLRGIPMISTGSVVASTRLIRVLGTGNFGTVWRARHMRTGQDVATKVFHLDRLTDGVKLWRFRRSIRALQSLNNYHDKPASIPAILEEAPDSLAFVMPYYPGGTLEQIDKRGWSLATKIAVFLEICRAVGFAHKIGVIHRDIKPANVLLDAAQRPILVDYDIADISFVTQLAASEGGLGTPVFAAPEQLEDAVEATERSDIYSLGRLLYYLLLERSPGYQIEGDPALDNLRGFHPALVAAIRRATQWLPSRRQASVAEFAAEVESHQSGYAAFRARSQGAWRWTRRHAAILSISTTVTSASLGMASMQRDLAQAQRDSINTAEESIRRNESNIATLAVLSEQLEALTTNLLGLTAHAGTVAEDCDVQAAQRIAVQVKSLGFSASRISGELSSTTHAIRTEQARQIEILTDASNPGQHPLDVPQGGAQERSEESPSPTTLNPSWLGKKAIVSGTIESSERSPPSTSAPQPLPVQGGRSGAPDAALVPAPSSGVTPPVLQPGENNAGSASRRLRRRSPGSLKAAASKFDSQIVQCVKVNRNEDSERPLSLTLSINSAGQIFHVRPSRPLQRTTQACITAALGPLTFGKSSGNDRYVHNIPIP